MQTVFSILPHLQAMSGLVFQPVIITAFDVNGVPTQVKISIRDVKGAIMVSATNQDGVETITAEVHKQLLQVTTIEDAFAVLVRHVSPRPKVTLLTVLRAILREVFG